jgi:hypothetical protein
VLLPTNKIVVFCTEPPVPEPVAPAVNDEALTEPVAKILVVPGVICTLPVELATDKLEDVCVVVPLPIAIEPVLAIVTVGEVVELPVQVKLVAVKAILDPRKLMPVALTTVLTVLFPKIKLLDVILLFDVLFPIKTAEVFRTRLEPRATCVELAVNVVFTTKPFFTTKSLSAIGSLSPN